MKRGRANIGDGCLSEAGGRETKITASVQKKEGETKSMEKDAQEKTKNVSRIKRLCKKASETLWEKRTLGKNERYNCIKGRILRAKHHETNQIRGGSVLTRGRQSGRQKAVSHSAVV